MSRTMTVRELIVILAAHKACAFVLQFYDGRWRASVRRREGIFVVVDHETMIGAISGLVARLGDLR